MMLHIYYVCICNNNHCYQRLYNDCCVKEHSLTEILKNPICVLLANTAPTDPPTWEWSRGACARGDHRNVTRRRRSPLYSLRQRHSVCTVQSRAGRGVAYISGGVTLEAMGRAESLALNRDGSINDN